MFSDGEWRFENNGGNDFKFPVLGEDWCCGCVRVRSGVVGVWWSGLVLPGCGVRAGVAWVCG